MKLRCVGPHRAGSCAMSDPIVCGTCSEQPAVVILSVEWADAVDVSPWCMDCAADVVQQELGIIVGVVDNERS